MRMWLLMWTWDDIQSGNGGLEEFLQATNRSTQSAAKWSSTDTHWFRYDMQPRFVPKNGCPTSGKTPFFIVVPQFSSLKLPCFFWGYHHFCWPTTCVALKSMFPEFCNIPYSLTVESPSVPMLLPWWYLRENPPYSHRSIRQFDPIFFGCDGLGTWEDYSNLMWYMWYIPIFNPNLIILTSWLWGDPHIFFCSFSCCFCVTKNT